MTFVCNDITEDPYLTFCMEVLSSILMEGPNTPFYLSLLDSGLGRQYVVGAGYDKSTREATFTFGVNDMHENDGRKVESAILSTLKSCMENGIDESLIKSAIHSIEIKHKELKQNNGLLLISSMIPFSLHGQDPLVPLYVNDYVIRLREELAQGMPVFQNIIRTWL